MPKPEHIEAVIIVACYVVLLVGVYLMDGWEP